MWGLFLFENEMVDAFETLRPHNILMDKTECLVGSAIAPTSSSIINMYGWLDAAENKELLDINL